MTTAPAESVRVNMRTFPTALGCGEEEYQVLLAATRLPKLSTLQPLAQCKAVFLQWETTGAAIMAIYLTPTWYHCLISRKGSGVVRRPIWLTGVSRRSSGSSWLPQAPSPKIIGYPEGAGVRRELSALVVALRQLAKLAAAINTTWILLSSLFQFSSFNDNCYCNSSVPGLGSKAYAVLFFNSEDQGLTKLYWIGGMIMASGTALFFVSATNLLTKWTEQHGRSE